MSSQSKSSVHSDRVRWKSRKHSVWIGSQKNKRTDSRSCCRRDSGLVFEFAWGAFIGLMRVHGWLAEASCGWEMTDV